MRSQQSGRDSLKQGARRAAIVAVAMAAGPAFADDSPNILKDSFNVQLGSFILNSDTKIRVDGETEPGTPVDLENTFGGADSTRFRLDGHWRFGDSGRHKIRALWFNTSHSLSKTLKRDLEFNDVVYPVNAKVHLDTSFDIYELAYEYALWHRDTWEINASAGIHMANLKFGLKAKAADSNGTLLTDISREAKLAAPLPVFGVRGLWQLPHNFFVDASAQFFSLSIDQYDGSVQDLKLNVTWQPKKWLGVGFGYNQFNVDVDVNTDNYVGKLDWSYSGPMIFYSATF